DGERLTERWLFDSDDPGDEGYAGQGNHNLTVADVDGDQKDEIVYGSATIDDDGTGLYTTGLGHGDAMHVSDFDPSRPGHEVRSDGERLTERWLFDSDDPGDEGYAGQGNHNLTVADVDGDQKDEIVYGSATIDDDGTGLYTTGLGHGDAMHVSDFDPSRPGLEVFAVHEDMDASGERGSTFRDAATGEVLWSVPAQRDTGRGAMADIDPRFPGAEGWNVGYDAE